MGAPGFWDTPHTLREYAVLDLELVADACTIAEKHLGSLRRQLNAARKCLEAGEPCGHCPVPSSSPYELERVILLVRQLDKSIMLAFQEERGMLVANPRRETEP